MSDSTARPDIAFIPTPADAIEAMIDLACLTAEDVVYDLGCGDGRLLIRAAQRAGCRGVGIDLDPKLLGIAQAAAAAAGVDERLSWRQGNLYESDLAEATVVMLYLLPHLNVRLRPRLLAQLQPGARIISHQFDMGDWPAEHTVYLKESEEDSTLYLWVLR